MSSHDYLVIIMAFAFMVTNLFGAAFTISRVHSKRRQQMRQLSTGASQGLCHHTPQNALQSTRLLAQLAHGFVCRYENFAFGPLAVGVIVAIFLALGVTVLRLW